MTVLRSSSTARKKFRNKVNRGRTGTQNSSRIYRVLILMLVGTRIRALREEQNREEQNRREAEAQSVRAS
jgi:hypothetical protein